MGRGPFFMDPRNVHIVTSKIENHSCQVHARLATIGRNGQGIFSAGSAIGQGRMSCCETKVFWYFSSHSTLAELCTGLAGFPTVYIYDQGAQKEEYSGAWSYDPALEYLRKIHSKYVPEGSSSTNANDAEQGMEALTKLIEAEKEPNPDINPEGKVVYLTDSSFEKQTHGSNWFVCF